MTCPWLARGIALAVFLFFNSVNADNLLVTCGSTVKLQHVLTKARLHSHQVAYSRGSQQQSVTGFPDGDDGNSLWLLHGLADEPCLPGSTFKKGTRLRLLHVSTRKWLHSHLYQSPLSSNQEVSAFGSDTVSDGGDVWVVEWDGKGKVWKQNTKVRFKHVDTGSYLFSHDAKYGNPIAGQFEVAAVGVKNRNTEWVAAEGIYMPRVSGNSGGADEEKDEL